MLTLRIVTLTLTLVVGSAIGVAGQDEEADPMAPAAFTAYPSGRPAMHDDKTGAEWVEYQLEATDPRASGLVTHGAHRGGVREGVRESGSFPPPWCRVYDGVVRLVNDDGAWTGTSKGVSAFDAKDPPLVRTTWMWELVGEGDYEGLGLYLVHYAGDKWTQRWGIIVPTDTVPTTAPGLPAE